MPKFPAPESGDAEFVFENAVFLAVADPAVRHILEVLRRGACSADEIASHVGDQRHVVNSWIPNLVAAKLVQHVASTDAYQLDRVGLGRLSQWVARLLD